MGTPSLARVKDICKLYYPQMLAHHAPRSREFKCNTVGCTRSGSFYMCEDCIGSSWYCQNCTVSKHTENPLHRLKRWDDVQNCMEPARLVELGLVVSLIHKDGTPCPSRSDLRNLSVLHSNGLHEIQYYQCFCRRQEGIAAARPEQLVANRMYGATEKLPKTAFTFEALKTFDVLNLEGALNIKQYLDGLRRLTPEKYTMRKEVRAPHIR
jgi:hypothetical protein